MDLSTYTNLAGDERIEVASTLHVLILDHLFRTTNWQAEDVVFHGGTALSLLRNSQRFSEDLDFMLEEKAFQQLADAIEETHKKVERDAAKLFPGSSIGLYGPSGKAATGWELRWHHPNRRGKVAVKVEFFKTTADLLKGYRTAYLMPTPYGRAIVNVATPIPGPELVSAWADKIKAIATREAFKWRDAFDLAFVQDHLMANMLVDDDALRTALASTAAIYGKTLEDVDAGLDVVIESGVLEDVPAFQENMRNWLTKDRWQMYADRNMFQAILAKTAQEIERAKTILSPAPGAKP